MTVTIEERMQNINDELKALMEELEVELLPKYLSPEQQKRVLKAFMKGVDEND